MYKLGGISEVLCLISMDSLSGEHLIYKSLSTIRYIIILVKPSTIIHSLPIFV